MTTAIAAAAPGAFLEDDAYGAPPVGEGLVPRERLVDALLDPRGAPVALVAAPAGFGKTSLLAEWALRDERPVGWITLDEEHDDPDVLTAAVEDVIGMEEPFGLVLDDLHALRSPDALEVVSRLAGRMPAGSRLALGTRREPALPIGRLRAHRALIEIRTRDLALDDGEAAALLALAGADLPRASVLSLLHRTAGWPAGLYLAALSVRDQPDVAAAAERFGGGDGPAAEYVRDVVLAGLPEHSRAFLRRTAVLDRLTPSICNAVLAGHDSACVLADLAGTDFLLTPDGRGGFRRSLPLLSDLLMAELRRVEPGAEPALRRRAAEWHVREGDAESAIEQSVAAGAMDRAGELIRASAPLYVSRGRNEVVRSWLREVGDERITADLRLAMCAACSDLAVGDLESVQRWESIATCAQQGSAGGEALPGVDAGLAIMRAAMARDGLEQMGRDAARAVRMLPDDSPLRTLGRLFEAVASHLTGDRERAEHLLEDGVRRGALAAPNVQSLCLAQLALLDVERGDWEGAAGHLARARAQVANYSLDAYPTSALVYAVSALVRAHRGEVDAAQCDARQAGRLLELLGEFAPWYEAEARVALARAALRMSDLPAARELITAATRRARRMPEAVVLHEWIAEVRERADAVSAAALAGPASLTTAELRILSFLPTHLSFREIAAGLYVSANTVKTQAHAVYRKLNASSRSQAVARATDLGLL